MLLAWTGRKFNDANSALDETIPVQQDSEEARTIFIGDIHGCSDELIKLLIRLDLKQKDRVVVLGDVIGKGPAPYAVLQWVQQSAQTTMLLGNHELGLLRILDQLGPVSDKDEEGGSFGNVLSTRLEQKCSAPARQQKALCNADTKALMIQLKRRDVAFLKGLPSYLQLPRDSDRPIIAVHGGLMPGIPLEEQDRRTMASIRNVLPSGAPSRDFGGTFNASFGQPWATLWNGPAHVVFGHDARRRLQQHPYAWGIDTGCVYGGNLTALVLPNWELEYVVCKAYVPV